MTRYCLGERYLQTQSKHNLIMWGKLYEKFFKDHRKAHGAYDARELNMTASWNVNVAEQGGYYVITPVDWNRTIANGQSVEFGCIGSGSIGNSLSLSIE